MIEFIDVPDDLLERDPARLPSKLRHLQEVAKVYKWEQDPIPRPRKLTKAEADELLLNGCAEGRQNKYVGPKPPIVPPRTSFLCELCHELKSGIEMTIQELTSDRTSWSGLCRACTIERRRVGCQNLTHMV